MNHYYFGMNHTSRMQSIFGERVGSNSTLLMYGGCKPVT